MWAAWMKFIAMLAHLKTKDMEWVQNHLASRTTGETVRASFGPSFGGRLSQAAMTQPEKKTGKLRDMKVRQLRSRRERVLQFDVRVESVQFEGVKKLSKVGTRDLQESSYTSSSHAFPIMASALAQASSISPLLLDRSDEMVFYLEDDLLPLIAFLDLWLEEIKLKDSVYPYRNKTEALQAIFNDAPSHKIFHVSP
jgi:hypothetical protein